MKLTPEEAKAEFDYTYAERLGLMCGADKPTREQIDMAFAEAETHVNTLKDQLNQG